MKKFRFLTLVIILGLFGCAQTVEPEANQSMDQLNNLIRLQQEMIDFYVAQIEGQEEPSDDELSLLRLTLSNQQQLMDAYLEEIEELNKVIETGETLITGDFTPGVHFGYSLGSEPSFAMVSVGPNGKIVNVLIDTVYLKAEANGGVNWLSRGNEVEGIAITKRAYDNGCSYHMHPAKDVINCQVDGELMWWQQVDLIAAAVVENQGLPNWILTENKIFGDDAMAGVTITVETYIEALEYALNQARN